MRLVISVAILLGTIAAEKDDFMGSCNVRIPQAFSCRSMPEWSDFLDAVQEGAKSGFKPNDLLLVKAQHILARWEDKPYPPQDFFKYLCGGDQVAWPLPDHFCLFGFVAALIIRSRHLMLTDDPEARNAANMDFGYAATVLGKEGSVDFLDSSPWPVSILDAYLNINETTFFTYEQYAQLHPVPPPAVPLESLHWRPTSAIRKTGRAAIPANVVMAVLGTHATLSLEPVEMLRRHAEGLTLRSVFYGLEPRWCQILGMCDQGTTALSQLFKEAEKDPFAFPWDKMVTQIESIYNGDGNLQAAEVLLCTEPLAGCLMLRQVAMAKGRDLPILGYLGVALLNSCPPEDIGTFWSELAAIMAPGEGKRTAAVLAVNNLILSEQIFYQSGYRMPYVRAHGLYTGMSYAPLRQQEILMWRAPLFIYTTMRCAMLRILEGMPEYKMHFQFVEESDSLPYSQVSLYKAVALVPWDHALMTFYELYSANMPLLMPSAVWMYRLLYQRGQLSVGERMYQSVMPGHTPPHAEFAEAEVYKEDPGPPNPSTGLASAKAARGVAEDMLTRGLKESTDLETARQYLKAALELVQDMRYFLAVAENKTREEDTYTSMGIVRRMAGKATTKSGARTAAPPPPQGIPAPSHSGPWHPYTPFQMSTRDSNDWTRMRKGGWWLRRGVRFDAMRYWYQFSDFARFPGLQYFANLPELMCMVGSLDVHGATEQMRRYNERTMVKSVAFWLHGLSELLT